MTDPFGASVARGVRFARAASECGGRFDRAEGRQIHLLPRGGPSGRWRSGAPTAEGAHLLAQEMNSFRPRISAELVRAKIEITFRNLTFSGFFGARKRNGWPRVEAADRRAG